MSARSRIIFALGLVWFALQAFPIHAAGGTAKKTAKPEARKVAKIEQVAANLSPTLDPQTRCLALSVYWEGRSEIEAGQVAIAHTVLNRARNGKFPRAICSVVTQGDNDGKPGCQFAWWCDGKSDEPTNASQWKAAVKAAQQAMSPKAPDPTGGALYFHGNNDNPCWKKTRTQLTCIGNHVFYR